MAVPDDAAHWFALSYGDPEARVVRVHQRTSGWLFMLAGEAGASWLRVGGVTRRTIDAVEAEGRAVSRLHALGTRVAKPRLRIDGAFAGPCNLDGVDLPAIAYEHLTGTHVPEPAPTQAEALGEVIATFHVVGDDALSVPSPSLPLPSPRSPLPLAEPISRATENVACCLPFLPQDDARWLERSVERAIAGTTECHATTRTTLCHGDLHLANVSFAGDQPTLFDFEGLCRAPPAYDLACMWRRRIIECGMTERVADWDPFLRGYARRRAFDHDEFRLLKLLAMLRAVWTMSLPAQSSATWGADWLRDPTYWRDHISMVRWFAQTADI